MSATVLAFIPRPPSAHRAFSDAAGENVIALPLPKPAAVSKATPTLVRAHDEKGEPLTDMQVADWCKRHGWLVLTANQRSFIDQIRVSLHQRPLSEKQGDWLIALVDKINRQVFGRTA